VSTQPTEAASGHEPLESDAFKAISMVSPIVKLLATAAGRHGETGSFAASGNLRNHRKTLASTGKISMLQPETA
jgi:hypothetical protein